MTTTTSLADYRRKKVSRSAQIRARLPYPVIDSDLHTTEFQPLLDDYVDKFGGAKAVDKFRAFVGKGYAFGKYDWYGLSPEERNHYRSVRPAWWSIPSKNTIDYATVSLPQLLHERLQDNGTDYAVLYPNIATFAVLVRDDDLRQPLIRAINTYHADVYRPYADRLTPVAAIPLHNPQEGIEELEHAVKVLKLKTALIPGGLKRPIEAVAERYPGRHHPDVAQYATYLDFFGIDSPHDYDPFWAKVIELKVPLTTHTGAMGWSARSSTSNYMFNHIGHFAAASHAFAKSIFLGGVTRRFPGLRFGFLEGGAGWGAQLYADLVGHWEKRGRPQVQNYDPKALDRDLLLKLYREHGQDLFAGGNPDDETLLKAALGGVLGAFSKDEAAETIDEFPGITSIEDIRDRFVPNFYFGSEADDPTVAHAFNTRVNPLGARLNAFWASDFGHWDVPDGTEVLAETWSLVERGAITEDEFRDIVFANPYRFYTEADPDFFRGTAIDGAGAKAKVAP
ncbi:amidohydrolase family protein [Zavarzinia compransoris]|uniref:Amidohydrolase n=1 Tax=Zavarzinia compransoris TaxID=1264899 RepID=A0A317DV26_9PROT|nr:amidohydrolase family protein [Zavarzinia compransoris]PWR18262.1 amidohydrolase [Zavarzinia compransoris]TDP43682.1 amidohydrolase family protein [Zavarzinia compransoris]